MSKKLKVKQVLIERVYFNSEINKFLDRLKNQHDKDIAGITLDFIKTTYPEFTQTLNGELILEETTEA